MGFNPPKLEQQLTPLQHTSGNKKAEEDAQKATEKQLEDIKQIGEKTGPKVCTIAKHFHQGQQLTWNRSWTIF
jgi:hypothetical protein